MPTIVKPMQHRRRDGEPGDMPVDFAANYRRIFGHWLKQKRIEAGLTQQQVVEILGLTPGSSYVSSMEIGSRSVVPEHLDALAKAYGIDPKDFAFTYLRWTNPWVYKMITGSKDRRLLDDLASIPGREVVDPFRPVRGNKSL